MTVKELIKELKSLSPKKKIYLEDGTMLYHIIIDQEEDYYFLRADMEKKDGS